MPEHSSRSNIFTPLSEIGLVLLAIGPTLALGGVHRSVQLAAALLSALCLLLVWLNRRPNGRGLILPWFGGALLVLCAATLFQLIPLPMGLLRALAPATVEVLEVSLAKAGGLPSTHPISLDPGSTLWEALKLACYSLAFIASHNFYYRGRRRHRLALSFTCLGIVMMFLALAGAVVAPGKPLMLYTPDAGRAAGLITTSFVNPNHSAGFLIICALMAMGLAIDTRDLQSKILLGLAAVMLGSGVMLTVSRGGILALALGMGLFSLLLFQARRRINLGQAAIILPSVLALIMLLSGWLAFDRLISEFSSIVPGEHGGLGKIAQWPSGLAMVLANPWVGVGRGAFMTTFPRYMRGDIPLGTYEYMENQFIQLPAEFGVGLGGAFLLASVLAWLIWLKRGRKEGKSIAATVAIFALAAHNLVDFSFEIIGIGLPLCLLAGAVSATSSRCRRCRESDSDESRRRHSSRRTRRIHTVICLFALGVTMALLGTTIISYPILARDDDKALGELARNKVAFGQYQEAANAAIRRHPSDYMPHLTSAHQAIYAENSVAIGSLNRALFLFPKSPKIHLEAARAMLRFGGYRQALLEYRLAMENGAIYGPVLRESIPLCQTEAELNSLLPDQSKIHARALRWLRLAQRLDIARSAADRGVKRWPTDEELCIQRAQVILAQKDKEAISAARGCVERAPSKESYNVLANATAALGPTGAEISVLLEGRQKFPESVNLVESLARAYLHHKDYANALKVAEQMLRMANRWQNRSRAHQVMARVHKERGQEHSAQYHLEQSRAIRKHH